MKNVLTISLLAISIHAFAQSPDLGKGISYSIETSGTLSTGDNAPLWLTANRQGLGSIERNSAYERAGLFRSMDHDSLHQWRLGYGIDLVATQNGVANVMVHQAYAEAAYKKISVIIGAKERAIDLRNNHLTSGGMSLGINATPTPQVLVEVDEFSVPFTNHWWKLSGRLGYGMTTDGHWQKSWAAEETKRTGNILTHEKAFYMHFGREDRFPLTGVVGIQMFAQFGGTSYNITGRNHRDKSIPLHHPENLNAFWHAFWPMGSNGDETDGTVTNVEGNQLGSYNVALQWKGKGWAVRTYAERFFEDHSMLTFQYGIYDHLLGIDATLPENRWVSHVLVEHLSTKDQAGPVYHDATHNMPDAIAGIDNYYNHSNYVGWQHWGMTMGHPFITAPLYNSSHELFFYNNRVQAWHIGLDGNPCSEVNWRILLSLTRNWGCYYYPLSDMQKQWHGLLEVDYAPKQLKGWSAQLALGIDHGDINGNNTGFQLRIRKKGILIP